MTGIPIKDVPNKLSLDSVMTFGQFKGQTVRLVAQSRPSYLVWAIKNVSWFELDAAARNYGQRCLNQKEAERMSRLLYGSNPRAWQNADFCDNDMQ